MAQDWVLILDFGSQYTQLIARRVRELKVYCEIHPFSYDLDEIAKRKPKGIILSGGPASVHDDNAPMIDAQLFNLNIPCFGICYGMQIMTQALGGDVERSDHREYGSATVRLNHTKLFEGLDAEQPVWMSHGDRILNIPSGFEITGTSDNSPTAAMAAESRQLYGVQFHPEVVHTPNGKTILKNFLTDICECDCDWTPDAFIESTIENVRAQVGDGHAICALSGGVDSSVAAALVHRALGDRLHCVFVDHGLLRQNEVQEVRQVLEPLGLPLTVVDASKTFLSELAGVTDPEVKRKTIGKLFIDVFEAEANKFENIEFLVQGTLYPDVIESVSVLGPSVVIKSHHNVGGLPERMNLTLVEPLRELFKDEVRRVGRALELPDSLLQRFPFPGPGLAIRVMGEITQERLDLLQKADAIVREELEFSQKYPDVWQAFAVLLPVQTVGVMGDERSYENVVAVRAVGSEDGMTAHWVRLPYNVLDRLGNRIPNEVSGINRVVYDLTSKPPGTIEWE
jgi:GMP synthase (glutamine-hydrolysing)